MFANQTTTNFPNNQLDRLKTVAIIVTAWGTAPPSCARENLR